MYKQVTKGWVPKGESNEATVRMVHASDQIYPSKAEAQDGEDIKSVKEVELTVICKDVVKEK